MAAPSGVPSQPPVKPLIAFAVGFVSSLMPTIVTLFNAFGQGHEPAVKDWGWFLPVAFFYAVSAGLFTVWWKPESEFRAVWIGISFSILVTNLYQNAPPIPGLTH